MTGEFAPRAQVVAEAWLAVGEGVEALSNAAGLPLARTTKLILDPLVVRPVQNPRLARTLLDPEAAAELTERITAAAPDLRATCGWFICMKQQRRARRITAGNPQEKYFQRAYELGRMHGVPGANAADIAGAEVEDVHEDARVDAAELRKYLADPDIAAAIEGLIAREWSREPGDAGRPVPDGIQGGASVSSGRPWPDDRDDTETAVPVRFGTAHTPGAADDLGTRVAAMLDACITGEGTDGDLADAGLGSATGKRLGAPGAARGAGLSDHDVPAPPAVGFSASKNALPKPFDRSILERLFVPISSLGVESTAELRRLVERQARSSADPWQLGDERGRTVMAAGEQACAMDEATKAGRRLRDRWRREGFVRRAERLGGDAADGAAGAFVRRLWARMHGRELRDQPVAADEVWDLIDGAMRSVILDRRDRAKAEMAGAAAPGGLDEWMTKGGVA